MCIVIVAVTPPRPVSTGSLCLNEMLHKPPSSDTPSPAGTPGLPGPLQEEPVLTGSLSPALPCVHASSLSPLCSHSPCPRYRRASSAQTAPTTSLSPWNGGSRRWRPAGGHMWCTAGTSSSRHGQSPSGTFTMKVG